MYKTSVTSVVKEHMKRTQFRFDRWSANKVLKNLIALVIGGCVLQKLFHQNINHLGSKFISTQTGLIFLDCVLINSISTEYLFAALCKIT
jgi:hypothetical protein